MCRQYGDPDSHLQFCIPWQNLPFGMKKAEKIEGMLRDLRPPGERPAGEELPAGIDPCYEGYFTCFNSQRYYEAHDVLEHLWLRTRDDNYAFYKGLIQFAGAFVHLQKQFQRPHHPKDRGRAHPAARLFRLAARNLAPYRPLHLHLDVERVWTLSTALAEQITGSGFANPWSPGDAPTLFLERS
jgi:predicted metal-dependent hydrolase